jgi:hypothetical protein
MYKFFGEPLKIINSKTSNKPIFRFDTKGEFITDDPEIIKRAMGFFDYQKMKAETTGEKVKKTFTTPLLTITTKDDKKEIKEEKKKFKCKKCEFETENQGDLMRHYKDHKKE